MHKPARLEPGHFLPTVARHIGFIAGFTRDDSSEVRFVTTDGSEWHPISTYAKDGVVWVDLVPVEHGN